MSDAQVWAVIIGGFIFLMALATGAWRDDDK